MSELYKTIGNYNLKKEGDLFGITDNEGHQLLPAEYNSIFYHGGGFIITKNSKSGYIKFEEEIPPHDEYESVFGYPKEIARHFVPCVYDRIKAEANGLVLCSMTPDRYFDDKRAWFDIVSGRLYDNLRFMRTFGLYDMFLDTASPNDNPLIKRRGEEFTATIPARLSGYILYEVQLYRGGAHYFVCSLELSDEETEEKGYICEFCFMVVLPSSYTFTAPKPKIMMLFEDFEGIVEYWDEVAKKEREMIQNKKEKNTKDEKRRNITGDSAFC